MLKWSTLGSNEDKVAHFYKKTDALPAQMHTKISMHYNKYADFVVFLPLSYTQQTAFTKSGAPSSKSQCTALPYFLPVHNSINDGHNHY